MIEAKAEPIPYQTSFSAGGHTAIADTTKDGVGGDAGMRPHELLAAALATCMAMTARMSAERAGHPDLEVKVRVYLEREAEVTRFRYEVDLDPNLDPQLRSRVLRAVGRCPVSQTLRKQIEFGPLDGCSA
jgi:putative redox protein